jgi:hypothetical protein
MDNIIHDLPSIGSVRLALHGLASLRKVTTEKIEAGEYDADEEELDYQADKVERLALAINEVASFYERLCEGDPSEPSVDTILKEYL